MSRRWLQNLLLIGLFLIAFTAGIAVGIGRGMQEHTIGEAGEALESKIPWEEAITLDPSKADQPRLNNSTIVYITPSGTKYHIYSDCSYLSRSKNIIGTPYGEVKYTEKDICSRCKDRYEYEQSK